MQRGKQEESDERRFHGDRVFEGRVHKAVAAMPYMPTGPPLASRLLGPSVTVPACGSVRFHTSNGTCEGGRVGEPFSSSTICSPVRVKFSASHGCGFPRRGMSTKSS